MAHLQRPPRMDPNGRAFFHFQSRRSRLLVQQRFTQQFKFTLQSRCLIEFLDDALLLSSVVSKVVGFIFKKHSWNGHVTTYSSLSHSVHRTAS